ncbi:hypothetical protein EW145_g8616, partial [Phellinidium pouzarii]
RFFSDASPAHKIAALKRACERHVTLTRECSKGLGQDRNVANLSFNDFDVHLATRRHLYALYCLLQRELAGENLERSCGAGAGVSANGAGIPPSPSSASLTQSVCGYKPTTTLPAIFTDPGWSLLSTSILSTSNCGNPALRLFGFGPVAADGYGIGYIIKDDGISVPTIPLPHTLPTLTLTPICRK